MDTRDWVIAWLNHRLIKAEVIQSQGPQSQGKELLYRWTLSDREVVTSVIVESHKRYLSGMCGTLQKPKSPSPPQELEGGARSASNFSCRSESSNK